MREKNLIVLTIRYTLTISTSLILTLTAFYTNNIASAHPLDSAVRPLGISPQSGTFDLLPTTLIRRMDISNDAWTPSSPDPSGIAYWPSRESLLIADSEVDEIPPYFTGENIFESSLTGSLLSTCSTTNASRGGWSNEPTGVAINPNNNHIFISEDSGGGKLHEVKPGRDGVYCTSDDTVTTERSPGNGDPEGIAYGDNKLFIAGGHDREVYILDLGLNGILGGGEDTLIASFSTSSLGFHDVEGIEYNPENGTLFIVSSSANDRYIGEVSLTGELVNMYNLDYLGKIPRTGLAYGPSSWNPATKSIYLISSGVDNGKDQDENDGMIWEIHLGDIPDYEEAPSVVSITREDPNPTDAASVRFYVEFSETVTGVDSGDFILSTQGGITSASLTEVIGLGLTYMVTVNTGTGNGMVRLDIIDRDSIVDMDGIPLNGPGVGNGSFTTGEFYEIQKGLILVEPASLAFEDSYIGSWSIIKTVTINNTGAGPIQLGKLSISDSETSGQAMFLMGTTCDNAILKAKETCTFRAAFRPVAQGAVSGQVTIPSDVLGQPNQVDLYGNGICRFPILYNLSLPGWLAGWACL